MFLMIMLFDFNCFDANVLTIRLSFKIKSMHGLEYDKLDIRNLKFYNIKLRLYKSFFYYYQLGYKKKINYITLSEHTNVNQHLSLSFIASHKTRFVQT